MNYLLMILTLLPKILDAIKSIQEFIPKEGAGQAKLEMLKDIMTETSPEAQKMMPAVERIVTIAVNTANKTGVFTSQAVPIPPSKKVTEKRKEVVSGMGAELSENL